MRMADSTPAYSTRTVVLSIFLSTALIIATTLILSVIVYLVGAM